MASLRSVVSNFNNFSHWRRVQLVCQKGRIIALPALFLPELKLTCKFISNKSDEEQGNFNSHSTSHQRSKLWKFSLLGATAIAGIGAFAYFRNSKIVVDVAKYSNNLPTYTAEEVAKHDSKERRIWVSYKTGIYDITDFVDKHPGGDIILMAAGGSLEPFWLLYQIHQNKTILDMLETFRIGNLAKEDQGQAVVDLADPYAREPKRHPALRPSSKRPYNAEPPLPLLAASYITPNDLFYVRNHLPVPIIDAASYELEISGIGLKSVSLSLEDLKTKFRKHTITATVQCAGNRRSEMVKLKPIKGLNWNAGAIGNATWSGVKLADVLKYASLSNNEKFRSPQHVQFEGADIDASGNPYGASIPIHKALDENNEVLLAYEMNGESLPVDHGFPVRVIVPGVVGARNVKWVNRIVISHEESTSHWQRNDYKGFPPHVDWDTVNFDSAPAIQELPVQSAICEPTDGSSIKCSGKTLIIKGYAWSGGGRGIVRVDVSLDGGKSWNVAKLEPSQLKLHQAWAWSIWKIELPIPENKGELDICCRAVDSSYNIQPDSVGPIWNLRGVLNNAWHHVTVKCT